MISQLMFNKAFKALLFLKHRKNPITPNQRNGQVFRLVLFLFHNDILPLVDYYQTAR